MQLRRLAFLTVIVTMLLAACGGSDDSGADPLRAGRSVYGDTCSVCHGNRGQGGVGPSLDTVIEVWPSCADQIEWITLGSEGWKTAHGDTFGATGRPVTGGMPGHDGRLTPEQIRLVAAFERVEYGGQAREEALGDCGITQP